MEVQAFGTTTLAVAPAASLPANAEPSPERLVAGLANVVAQAGYEPLVCSILLLADRDHFPDRWQAGSASAARVALRLVHYAGLEGLDVDLQVVKPDSTPPVARPESRPGEVLAAWFIGLSPGKIQLGLDHRALADPLLVVAALARAVAQAFAVLYGIVKADGEPQSEAVDLCAIYLGFGILTTNAALRFIAASGGGVARVQTLGRLPWRDQAHALAMVAVLRRLSKGQIEEVARCLNREQKEHFLEVCRHIANDSTELAQAIGLPNVRQWPAPVELQALLKPMPVPVESDDHDRGIVGQNRGKPVFRVERRMALRMFKIALGASFAGGMLVRLDRDAAIDANALAVVSLLAVVIVTVVGGFFKERRCSEPKCDCKLSPDLKTCPRCGGDIVGVILHPRERLAAEDKWLAQQRIASTEVVNAAALNPVAAASPAGAGNRELGGSSAEAP